MEHMKKNIRLPLIVLLLIGVALAATGCGSDTPLVVYWTATYAPTTPEVTEGTAVAATTELPTDAPAPTAQASLEATVSPAVTTVTEATAVAVLPSPVPPTADSQPQVIPPVTVAPISPNAIAPQPTISPISVTPQVTDEPTPSVLPDFVPRPLPDLDRARVGVQLDINLSQDDWNYAMSRIEQLGVSWVKVQLPWRDMQPNGPNDRDNEFFLRTEQYLEDASNRGFNVLVSIVKAPNWARSVLAEDGTPDNPADLANFITILLEEVNPGLARDLLGNYIDAIEIWNEPNLLREWQGTIPFNGAGYMQLFRPAYDAIRAYSSSIIVITAGLAPTSTSAVSVDDRDFLRQMYQAGLGAYDDVMIGAHPYGWGNAPDDRCCNAIEGRGWDDDPHFFFLETLQAYREIMSQNGDADTPMFITEFGYASWDGFPTSLPAGSEWMAYNDRYRQGVYTIRALQIAQERNVAVTVLWNLNFATLTGLIANSDERAAYSMLVPGTLGTIDVNSSDRTERPIFWMLYDALRPEISLDSY
jgi:hypothetical protein